MLKDGHPSCPRQARGSPRAPQIQRTELQGRARTRTVLPCIGRCPLLLQPCSLDQLPARLPVFPAGPVRLRPAGDSRPAAGRRACSLFLPLPPLFRRLCFAVLTSSKVSHFLQASAKSFSFLNSDSDCTHDLGSLKVHMEIRYYVTFFPKNE